MALGRGGLVKSEDVERDFTDIRVVNGLGVSKSASDVCVCAESGDNFRDGGRKRYIYLMVMPECSPTWSSSWIMKFEGKKKRSKRHAAKSARCT